jgi:hypothetical protein
VRKSRVHERRAHGFVMSREHEVRLPDRFWRRSTCLSLDAQGLYSILLTFINYQTCITFVSNPRLERETGYGIVKVKALLSELETNGNRHAWAEMQKGRLFATYVLDSESTDPKPNPSFHKEHWTDSVDLPIFDGVGAH